MSFEELVARSWELAVDANHSQNVEREPDAVEHYHWYRLLNKQIGNKQFIGPDDFNVARRLLGL